jgi:hypothetical protein
MMDKMNTKKFKVFVEALESLPEHIRNNKVDMHKVQVHLNLAYTLYS